jgi:hypothetical protein
MFLALQLLLWWANRVLCQSLGSPLCTGVCGEDFGSFEELLLLWGTDITAQLLGLKLALLSSGGSVVKLAWLPIGVADLGGGAGMGSIAYNLVFWEFCRVWLLWERFWVILNRTYLFVQRGCAFLCRSVKHVIGVIKDGSFNLANQYTSVALGLLSRKHM